jgi:hypothetical protein
VPNVIPYIGRTIDVAAFQNVTDHKTLLVQALAEPGKSGTILTGVAKLGQRFLMELLTKRGSMRFLPNRGCNFMIEAQLGYIRTQFDLLSSFSRALLDVAENLKNEEADTDPLDERFGSAEIDSLEFDGSNAKIFIRVTSLDPNAQVILPVSTAL